MKPCCDKSIREFALKIDKLISEEIVISLKEKQSTSRLTSLAIKIGKLLCEK